MTGSPSEAFEGLRVDVKHVSLDPDFHAVAVVSIQDLDKHDGVYRDGVARQGPSLQLDVVALSGPGDLRVVIQDVKSSGPGVVGAGFYLSNFGLFRLLLGIVHPTDDPPEEGLAYHVRTYFTPSWTQVEGGSSGPGFRTPSFSATSHQYSVSFSLERAVHNPYDSPDFFGMSFTSKVSSKFSWNGDVW